MNGTYLKLSRMSILINGLFRVKNLLQQVTGKKIHSLYLIVECSFFVRNFCWGELLVREIYLPDNQKYLPDRKIYLHLCSSERFIYPITKNIYRIVWNIYPIGKFICTCAAARNFIYPITKNIYRIARNIYPIRKIICTCVETCA